MTRRGGMSFGVDLAKPVQRKRQMAWYDRGLVCLWLFTFSAALGLVVLAIVKLG